MVRATRLLMERDEFREQFWAAFDAFVPGTPDTDSARQGLQRRGVKFRRGGREDVAASSRLTRRPTW